MQDPSGEPMTRRQGCAWLMSLALATPSFAGTVVGDVVMRGPAEGETRVRPAQTVVWLEAIPEKTERDLARGPRRGWFGRRHPRPAPRLAQTAGRFEPRVVTVVAGRKVVIRNNDKVWHGVFSVSRTGAFDLGKRAPGRADSVLFEKPGVIAVRCDLHPDESAFVVVTPNHASAQAHENGAWRLPEVPEGRYVLRAWAPGRSELRRDVDVPRKGEAKVSLRW